MNMFKSVKYAMIEIVCTLSVALLIIVVFFVSMTLTFLIQDISKALL